MVDSQIFAQLDIGSAIAYLCLEAAEQGVGACIIGMYDRETLSKLLGIPIEQQYGSLIAFGYPESDVIRPKDRKPLEKLVRYV
jgi:nitroreductase